MKHSAVVPSFREDTNFAYLVGRVRALESGLLTQKILDNLLRADDLEQALRVIAEVPYWGTVLPSSVRSLQAIDEVLVNHYWEIVEDFRQYKVAFPLVNFFTLGFDFSFLKLALKYHLAKKDLEKSYPTTLESKRVLRFFSGEGGEFLPHHFEMAIRETLTVFETHAHNVQLLELVLDRFYLQEVYRIATTLESEPLRNWLFAFVTFAYIKAALRARCQGKKPEVMRFMYFANPLISQESFLRFMELPSDKVSELVGDFGFDFLFPQGVPFRDDSYYLAEVEKNINNYLMRFARSFRAPVFGPEPVFGFLFAKGVDVKNLRIVLEGKYFAFPQEELRNKMRECYYE